MVVDLNNIYKIILEKPIEACTFRINMVQLDRDVYYALVVIIGQKLFNS